MMIIEEDDGDEVCLSWEGGRIKIERRGPDGGIAIYFDEMVARQLARGILGIGSKPTVDSRHGL